ncbi:MAG: iron-containing alcohol dehydrogenase [Rhizobacter sp.]
MNTTTTDYEFTLSPASIVIAKKLAALVHAIPGPNTDKRERLSNIFNHLCAKQPDAKAAFREAMDALRGTDFMEDNHEDVLLIAIVKLLSVDEVAAPRVKVPEVINIKAWLEKHGSQAMAGRPAATDNEGLPPSV